MAELAKYQAKFANSQVQFMNETRETLQIQRQLERLEVQVGQMDKILLEEQQRSLPTLEEPIIEKEYDGKELKDLVVKEDELTSLKSHEKIKDDVIKTTSEMAPLGEMHEESKIAKVTPMSKVEECTIQMSKEMGTTIVIKKN